MRAILIMAVLVAGAAAAQNVAVKFWADEPTNAVERVLGIPTNWPAQVSNLGTGTNAPSGWQLMTTPQFEAVIATRRAAHDAWRTNTWLPYLAAQRQQEVNERLAMAVELRQLRLQCRQDYQNWTNLTAGEKLDLIRKLMRLDALRDQLKGESD